jgi:HSP20 family protein
MAFARWNPARDLFVIHQRLDKSWQSSDGWTPPIDVYETSEEFVIVAEVPGLRRQDLEIQVRHDSVTLAGVRRKRDVPCEQYHQVERGHGGFRRTFQLAQAVDADRTSADLRQGVLTVVCPKAHESAARRIDVT